MIDLARWAPRHRAILDTTESFLVTYPANHASLDLAPFGVPIPRLVTATSLASRDLVDGLHRLDAASFGDLEMLMPRWVLFDCGALPGVVFGFGRRARDLPERLRAHYGVHDRGDVFVPLSMWVAIRCAEDGAWFGHNLSSANLLLDGADRLPGLATLTKCFGLAVTRAVRQYGATQWDSASLAVHLRFGDLHLLSAYTPAHTHPETLSYRLEVSADRLARCLRGEPEPRRPGSRVIDAGDSAAILALQHDLEAGARLAIVGVDRTPAGQRVHLR